MKHNVILVVLDGLNYEVARHAMGHLQAYVGAGRAALYQLECELPALSRPLYECILTGVPPIDSGIVHNNVSRLSNQRSIYHYARDAGLKTAAAAYHWVSELYNRSPFVAARDRHTDNLSLPIQHGHFYWSDHYPDSHLFADAENLRLRHDPDFLLIHPMNIDDAGHKHGLDSSQYRNSARSADIILADYLQSWLDAGYQVLVTADHGMNNDRSHNGLLPEERQVPLFVLGDAFSLTLTPRRNKRKSAARSANCSACPTTNLCAGSCSSESMTRGKWLAALCLVPFALFFIVFEIAPLVWVMINSLQSEEFGWGIENFTKIFSSKFYLQAIQYSLEISFWSSVFGIIIAVLGAYSLRRVDSKLRNFVNAFANMTSNFAGVPLAFAFIILLGFNGSITIMLKQAGIIEDFNLYSKTGLIILYTYFQIPLGVLLLYPAFDALREDWRESAALLGANGWQFWRHIGLPVLTPALLGTFVILLANALGAYATVYALTTGNFNVLPIRIAAMVSGDISLDPNLASALAVVLVALMTIVTVVHQLLLKRSYHVSR
jgi:putative spermidine/putrescine transport system permease protein